ncbi:hypothetical protein IW140_006234 [Coemansia sp. RSA 1813]|nr:hypothetical protein IW138_006206 [Coemansia sp. RSA 986]KAJ2210459.1 hypothetical protein EV179_006228 [Coemansia sp. RSA 487]KAJ2563069.1 hypothetical protein IW140_006234 [Coemansia sp. RSA 1813]
MPSAKIPQYQRDRPTAQARSGMQSLTGNSSPDVSGSVNTNNTTESTLGAKMPPTTTGPYLAPGARQESSGNVWSVSRLFTQKSLQQQQQNGTEGQSESKPSSAVDTMPVYACKPGEHPLQFAWSFWFMHRAPGHKIDDYEAAMIRVATFASVESFWASYSHLRRTDQVPTITDYHMFRAGVRPVWEDPANVAGGKWMVRLKKGISPRMWEKLAIAVVGGAFDAGDEVCGIVISIRNSEDIISLWNKTAIDHRANGRIRDTMKHVMGLPTDCIIQYKAHNDSLRDTSTFRNADISK